MEKKTKKETAEQSGVHKGSQIKGAAVTVLL